MTNIDQMLRDCVTYDPDTGLFYGEYTTKSGKVMPRKFTYVNRDGYLDVGMFKRRFLLHRLAWFLFYGSWPNGILDHINRVKTDNRIANLRLATFSQNVANQDLSSRNKTGFRGVSFNKKANKFQASIGINNKVKYLGVFDTAIDAALAYDDACKKTFGAFAVPNMRGQP